MPLLELSNLSGQLFSLALASNLRQIADAEKAVPVFLRVLGERLGADAVWLMRSRQALVSAQERWVEGESSLVDDELSRAFLCQESPAVPRHMLLAPLWVLGRREGVVGVARSGREFPRGQQHRLMRIVEILAADLSRREEERETRLLDRVREKLIAELRPRDLAYQVFDALLELVRYDHSATFLLHDEAGRFFRVEAEKVVWTKTKSAFVGHEIPASEVLVAALARFDRVVVVFAGDCDDECRRARELFAPLEAYYRGHSIPSPTSVLYAPLLFDGKLLGVLRIAAHQRLPFDRRDAGVVERFLPLARVAMRNARMKLSLENQALAAEMRAGLVTLARAVAHDVNGAVGTILLLGEQLRDEARSASLDPSTLAEDLDAIVLKAKLCQRIFSNMLRLGGERAGAGPVDLNHVVREILPILEAQVGDRPISLEARLAESLPCVRASRAHLERIVWNLVTNAIEALQRRPGRIEVATEQIPGLGVVLAVEDDGPGIPPELLSKVQEPFFSTKPDGTGLGLAICRSLAWHSGGGLSLSSSPGHGTRVEVQLPLLETPR